jgi:hypothetical protein
MSFSLKSENALSILLDLAEQRRTSLGRGSWRRREEEWVGEPNPLQARTTIVDVQFLQPYHATADHDPIIMIKSRTEQGFSHTQLGLTQAVTLYGITRAAVLNHNDEDTELKFALLGLDRETLKGKMGLLGSIAAECINASDYYKRDKLALSSQRPSEGNGGSPSQDSSRDPS